MLYPFYAHATVVVTTKDAGDDAGDVVYCKLYDGMIEADSIARALILAEAIARKVFPKDRGYLAPEVTLINPTHVVTVATARPHED